MNDVCLYSWNWWDFLVFAHLVHITATIECASTFAIQTRKDCKWYVFRASMQLTISAPTLATTTSAVAFACLKNPYLLYWCSRHFPANAVRLRSRVSAGTLLHVEPYGICRLVCSFLNWLPNREVFLWCLWYTPDIPILSPVACDSLSFYCRIVYALALSCIRCTRTVWRRASNTLCLCIFYTTRIHV